jgi:hypothetical protein
MFFNKHDKVSQDIANFSMQHIGTGQIGGYILTTLHKKFPNALIGYRWEKQDGELRGILYTSYPTNCENRAVIHYFQDRCNAMIEAEVKKAPSMKHSFVKWGDGLEVVCEYKENK